MALGPFCKALGIDEEVLTGQKTKTCELNSLSNGVMWELKKYKTAKKLSMKDVVDWIITIFELKCENSETIQEQLNEKFESLSDMRNTLLKSPKNYRGEMERLMNWSFELPTSMGVEQFPVFEPMVRANLGPKLLKVLKEKGGDDDDSIDMSGDDDDEQAKKRKAREEIVQLKKDLGSAKKTITLLNDKMTDLSKRCQILSDLSKSSVSERRRIESDIAKLKIDWENVIIYWHDCIERLNHVNSNKGNYLDVGYMVRRNKTKQGIFDELNYEFEKTLEEFKHKVTTLIEKERRKKKVVSREYRQKSKSDRKRVRQETEDGEESKRPCLADEGLKQMTSVLSVDEFLKSEKVDEFKGGKFVNALKAIYMELIATSACNNIHEIIFRVLEDLEALSTDKIPSQSFAGNILMESRMAVSLESFSSLLKASKVSICNDGATKFTLTNTDYEVTLVDDKKVKLGVRDITEGSPDTSLSLLRDLLHDLMNAKAEGNQALETLSKTIRSLVNEQNLLDKKLVEILFSFKQQISPLLAESHQNLPDTYKPKCSLLNTFCTGVYLLLGLAKLADVAALAWESLLLKDSSTDDLKTEDSSKILSKTLQKICSFCEKVDNNSENINMDFKDFREKDKKLFCIPLAPCKGNVFNTVFHNSAGVWFYYEIGLIAEFFEKLEKKSKPKIKKPESVVHTKDDEDKSVEIKDAEVVVEKTEASSESATNDTLEIKTDDDKVLKAAVKDEEKGDVELDNVELKEEKTSSDNLEDMEVDTYINKEEYNFLSGILKDKHTSSLARALGLIGKLVAVPLWTVLEDEDVRVGDRYTTFLKCIENWAKDSSKFMRGQEKLFEDVPVSHDAVYVSLVKDNETSDALTKDLLELLFSAFVPYVKSFLHGSARINGESAMEITDSNIPFHMDSSGFDRITMNIHSVTNFVFDSLKTYGKARNCEWQDKLCNKENIKVFGMVDQAYNAQMKILYKHKISLKKIKEKSQGTHLDSSSRSPLIEMKYKVIDDLIKWGGLWKSEEEMEGQIKHMKEHERLNALKAQIRFRRHVLGEENTNGLLDLASEGECFTSEKLYKNLKSVLKKESDMTETDAFELASATTDEKQRSYLYDLCKNAQELKWTSQFGQKFSEGKEDYSRLLGKFINHTIVLEHGKESVKGIVFARKKLRGTFHYYVRYTGKGVLRVSSNQIREDLKNHNFRVIDPLVNDLVGSRLSRAFIKDDGDLEWHDCKVIGVTSGGSDFVIEFDFYGNTVQLDEDDTTKIPDPDTFTFTARLLEDYHNDRLRLL